MEVICDCKITCKICACKEDRNEKAKPSQIDYTDDQQKQTSSLNEKNEAD